MGAGNFVNCYGPNSGVVAIEKVKKKQVGGREEGEREKEKKKKRKRPMDVSLDQKASYC